MRDLRKKTAFGRLCQLSTYRKQKQFCHSRCSRINFSKKQRRRKTIALQPHNHKNKQQKHLTYYFSTLITKNTIIYCSFQQRGKSGHTQPAP